MLNVVAIPVGLEERPDSETVSQIMNPGPCRSWSRGQSRPGPELSKGGMDVAVEQPGASRRNEQRWSRGRWLVVISSAPIAGDGSDRAGVQRELPGFAELAEMDGEHTAVAVEIVTVESDGFPDPDPGAGQEPDERPIVATRNGDGNMDAASIRAATSSSE